MPTRKQQRDAAQATLVEDNPAKRVANDPKVENVAAAIFAPRAPAAVAKVVSSTRARTPEPVEEAPAPTGWAAPISAIRTRLDSVGSDVSDDLEAIDRELEAEAAAAANAETQRRAGETIKDVEIDHVTELIYETMEEQAMMEILGDLQDEYLANGGEPLPSAKPTATAVKKSKAPAAVKAAAPSPPTTCAEQNTLLWDVVATPAMMRAFASTVANSVPQPV